ncbi:MAG: hypothetical protein Q9216_002641 [Gyalolechia sp. 2 TL-2023]
MTVTVVRIEAAAWNRTLPNLSSRLILFAVRVQQMQVRIRQKSARIATTQAPENSNSPRRFLGLHVTEYYISCSTSDKRYDSSPLISHAEAIRAFHQRAVDSQASSPISQGESSYQNDFVPLPGGWRLRPQNAVGIRPAPISASKLEELYRTLFSTAAQNFWSDLDGFQRPFMDVGQLFWFIEPAQQSFTVPWHVIAAFAFGMLEKTSRGWTNLYEFLLEGPDRSSYMIYLSLKPVPPERNTPSRT